MRDLNYPVLPSLDEIRAWAFDRNAKYPCQDWDIINFTNIGNVERTKLVLALAADPECPKREAFVHFLYCLAGQVFRNGYRELEVRGLRVAIDEAADSANEAVREWAAEATSLLNREKRFIYAHWFIRRPKRKS